MDKNALYEYAKAQYASIGVDTDKAIETLAKIPVSLHCWQGDDVGGFEHAEKSLGGGLAVTGNYPGKATSIDELRCDISKALSLIPGKHRLNLHASYADFSQTGFVDRDMIEKKHFASWLDWAKENNLPLDFNATIFGHPKVDTLSLSNPDKSIRDFWIEHVKRCREISAWFGQELNSPCIHNTWIPDGMKDYVADRRKYREILKSSLDEIMSVKYSKDYLLDAVESKVFGIGSESYVVGSHEFYMGYAITHDMLLTLDMGHFHQGENVADKISSTLLYVPGILFHLSRGVRWDSDHVTIQNDEITNVCHEIISQGPENLDKIHLGLDYFDGSINRIGAWVTGNRCVQRALLAALLEPQAKMREYEDDGKLFERLYSFEQGKAMPFSLVWDHYCESQGVPTELDVIAEVQKYEKEVLSKRA